MPATLTLLFLALFGLAFGSFGNVVVDRIQSNTGLGGRSHCDSCKKVLRPWELVPVLSFLFLRGRCARCKAPIAWEFTLVECVTGLLFVLAGVVAHDAFFPGFALGLCLWTMLLIGIIDARTQLIPDVLTAVLALCAVVYHLLLGDLQWTGLALALVFFGVQWLASRGAWVGSGDILLGMALGLLLGSWQHVTVMLMAAYIVGALLVSVLLGMGNMKRTQQIAFGPFLVLGAMVALLFGDEIIRVVWPM